MDSGLSGKVVAITGGSRGLGRELAKALASHGAHIAIGARDHDSLTSAHAEIEGKGVRCFAYAGDFSEESEAAAFLSEVGAVFGRLDAAVCAVALGERARNAADRASRAQSLALGALHLEEVARGAAALFEASGGGAVLGLEIAPGGAGNAALVANLSYLAHDLARYDTRVNVLSIIDPTHVLAHPGPFVDVGLFLVSRRSAAINGTVLPVSSPARLRR